MDNQFKQHVELVCDKLRHTFFCGEYSLRVVFHKEPEFENGDKDKEYYAWIDIDYRYLRITVHVYRQLFTWWKAKRYWSICETLTHEFSHTITNVLFSLSDPLRCPHNVNEHREIYERQTQRIANIVMTLLEPEYYKPKRKKR